MAKRIAIPEQVVAFVENIVMLRNAYQNKADEAMANRDFEAERDYDIKAQTLSGVIENWNTYFLLMRNEDERTFCADMKYPLKRKHPVFFSIVED